MPQELKSYTPREERLNAGTHLAGVVLTAAGMFRILSCTQVKADPLALAAVLFYTASLFFMFGCSGVYHLLRSPGARATARKLDHCAIYFLITGSYAPVLYLVSRDLTGLIIFLILVLLSIGGCFGKFIYKQLFHRLEILLYILMGWCCVFIAGKVFRQLPPHSLWLMFAGGISYTAGVAAYVSRREFAHVIWHIMVLLGAALQFFAFSFALDL